MKKLNRILTEEEDSGQSLKVLSHFTIKKTRMDWQGFDTIWQRKTGESFVMMTNFSLSKEIYQKTYFELQIKIWNWNDP